jgi:hypothetical protein
VKAALLRGRHHLEIGAVGEAALDSVAAALSRGGAEKPYPHVDPNEDAALVASGARGSLVAVADGHWGHRGAERALERLLADHVQTWTEGRRHDADAWYQAVLGALVDLNDAVLARTHEGDRSRCTLALALVRPAEELLISAAVGDSLLFRVDAKGVTELPRASRPLFLGQERVRASAFERCGCIAVGALEAPRAVVAVTDGLSEEGIGVADASAAVLDATVSAEGRTAQIRAAAAARALVEAALGAHRSHAAGDNVAAAVAWCAH